MIEKDIEVVLVYEDYEKDDILEVSASDYPIFVKIGQWSEGKELIIQPHLRAKVNEKYENVDIAIKVTQNLSRTIKNIKTLPSGYDYRPKNHNDYIYYLPPRKQERNKFNNMLQDTITGHYTTIGKETIKIIFDDGHSESMTLISKFLDDEKNFYEELIVDLISMQQQLCVDNSSSMSMAIKWSDNLYQETEHIIKEFCDTFWIVKENAKPELKPLRDKKSFYKIKKISSQALIEHEIFHKNKVTSISYKEDFDTFEHRVIKTHLKQLKSIIKVRQNMESLVLENEKSRLEDSLGFSEAELKKKIKELNSKLEDKKQNLINKLDRNDNADKLNLSMVYVQFKIIDVRPDTNGCIISCNAANGKIQIKSIDAKNCNYKVKLSNEKWSECWKEYKSNAALAKKTRYINISADCTRTAAIIYYYLSSKNCIIKKNDIVGICGNVISDYDKGINEKKYSLFDFIFRDIKAIYIFEQINDRSLKERERKIIDLDTDTEQEKLIKKEWDNYISDLDLQFNSESIGFYKESLNSEKQLREINQKLKNQQKWKLLDESLNEIETNSFMVDVKNIRTPIRISNLFAFHPSYQRIYAIMTKNNKEITGIDYYSTSNDDEFRVAKLSSLYEIWCCLKLILIFIQNYGFKFISVKSKREETGIEGLKNYIQNVLNNNEMSGTQFDLRYAGKEHNIDITIWYDREIKIDKEKLKKEGIFAKKEKTQLRPDIVMKIRVDNKKRLFILDAKYRGNGAFYDGMKDICEVAFQKYTLELGHGMNIKEFDCPNLSNENIDGSFIIHSNSFAKPITIEYNNINIKYDPKNYLGTYPDKLFAAKWSTKIKENKWEVSCIKFEEWVKFKAEIQNHENHIGIIAANPRENKMAYLIQMIMEQHFGLYKFRCWICGSDDIHVECKYTEKGYLKYHIICKNPECKKFMVETHCANSECPSHTEKLRLGKHYVNYLAQQKNKNACWNVSCPKCREILSFNS